MATQWTKERIREWYHEMPWLRGCNYLPADCCNRIAFWQELDWEQHLATADRELELAAATGFNSVRMLLEFIVWDEQHDGFLLRFEQFLAVAAKHGISVMVCFANDCTVPKDENYRPQQLGPQPCDWGYHGGRRNSPHSTTDQIGYYPALDEPENAGRFYAMVEEIVTKYAADPRIVIWDLYNEAGAANRGDVSVPHVKRIFDVARSVDPIQPLTSCVWRGLGHFSAAEKTALELSDLVSYHNYGSYADNVVMIDFLRRYGRPIINTEWLHRQQRNTVQEMFPLFFLEKIGCWNWGFVAGLSQTYEPWEYMYQRYSAGERDIDFTKWQHDLFRPSLRPYDPREIELIERFCLLADTRHGQKKQQP